MATAQVIFQRFYYSKSLVKHDGEVRNIFVHVRLCSCRLLRYFRFMILDLN